jgi:hypothetical protein
MQWPITQIATSGLATGINDFGWVVGETIDQGGSDGRIVHRFRIADIYHLAGVSHPFIWSQASGLVALPSPMITAEAVSGKFVCGTQLAADGTIHGVLTFTDWILELLEYWERQESESERERRTR